MGPLRTVFQVGAPWGCAGEPALAGVPGDAGCHVNPT